MNKKPLRYIEFTMNELQQFVNDKSSCVKRINTKMHIGFPPWGLSNFKEYLTGLVKRKKIGRYDEQIGGIVLDVRNIKVQGSQFAVHDDSANLHVDLVADFYVFIPTVDCIIQGTIKHIAPKHISVILYRLFNVTILINGKQHDHKLNSDVFVRITDFNLSYTIPSIQGELHADLNANKRSLSNGLSKDEKANGSSDESSSESDTDSDADNRQHKKILMQQIVNGVKIKQERRPSVSDSEDDNDNSTAYMPTQSIATRNIKESGSSSTSESESDSHSSTSRCSNSDSTASSRSDSELDSFVNVKQEKTEDNGLNRKRKHESESKPSNYSLKNVTIKVEKDLLEDSSTAVVKTKREKKSSRETESKADLKQAIMQKILSKFK